MPQLGFQSLSILIKSLWLCSGGDRNNIVLHQPSEEYNDLGGIMRLRYTGQGLPQRPVRTPEGGCLSLERSNLNAILTHPWNIIVCALEICMIFDLIDDRRLRCSFERRFDIGAHEITHANRLRFTRLLHLFHRLPRALEVRIGIGEEGDVNQVPPCSVSKLSSPCGSQPGDLQVKVLHLHLPETLVKCCRNVFDALGNFVGNEELFAGDTGGLDRNANLFFSAIHLCTVQMIETLLNGCFGQFHKARVKVCVADILEPSCSSTKSELYNLSVGWCY
jgi:hypothetical protein